MQNSSVETITSDDKSGNSDMAKTAFEVASELILQPHQVPVSSGGGDGNDSGDWGETQIRSKEMIKNN